MDRVVLLIDNVGLDKCYHCRQKKLLYLFRNKPFCLDCIPEESRNKYRKPKSLLDWATKFKLRIRLSGDLLIKFSPTETVEVSENGDGRLYLILKKNTMLHFYLVRNKCTKHQESDEEVAMITPSNEQDIE